MRSLLPMEQCHWALAGAKPSMNRVAGEGNSNSYFV